MNGRCCVFQPFDHGTFDKRYDDTLVPAIREAGLEPYRVDRDESAVIPMDTLHDEIKSSRICLADVSDLNPNVMYELGFAIASEKDVIIISDNKTKFPFDIQHRGIVPYSSGSHTDLTTLQSNITKRINALLKKQITVKPAAVSSPVRNTSGLMPHEISLLAIIHSIDDGTGVHPSEFKPDMFKAGYNDLAISVGLISLTRKKMIEAEERGDGDEVFYNTTLDGVNWLVENQEHLELSTEPEL
jgi:hypothetical protein